MAGKSPNKSRHQTILTHALHLIDRCGDTHYLELINVCVLPASGINVSTRCILKQMNKMNKTKGIATDLTLNHKPVWFIGKSIKIWAYFVFYNFYNNYINY